LDAEKRRRTQLEKDLAAHTGTHTKNFVDSTTNFVYVGISMKKKAGELPKPTRTEQQILAVLWRLGEATVRQVHEELDRERDVGYTTVLKLMQIMADKGLLVRREEGRAHVYRAAAAPEETQRQLLTDLADRVFGGSAAQLVMRALSASPATQEELDKIRRMLDQQQGKKK
jgi:BlaI family penicillinase repressor